MAQLVRKDRGEDILPALLRWDPLETVRRLVSGDLQEMLPLASKSEVLPFIPRFDIKETKSAFIFKADLPGMAEKDLEISLTGNRLTVSGKREMEEAEEGESYYAWERQHGTFSRSFSIPQGADLEHIEAGLANGVLTIVVAKKPEMQAKKIDIKGAVGGMVDKVKGVLNKDEKARA